MAEVSGAVSRKPFFSISLTPQEIEEDLALIISSTKRDGRKRKRPMIGAPSTSPPGGSMNGGGQHGASKGETASSSSNHENPGT